jgi:uncharacterized Zn finger protein
MTFEEGGIGEIAQKEIERLCDSTIFSRGMDYYLRGCVVQRKRDDEGISAVVLGGRDYRVEIRPGKHFRCSCPFEFGGACKHVVATLLAWSKEPESFVPWDFLTRALEKRTKADLMEMLRRIFVRYPHLVDEYGLR